MQQINFTRNLDRVRDTMMFSLLKKPKKLFYIFYKELCEYRKFRKNCFSFIKYQYKMTYNNSVNVKMLNSQLDKLESVAQKCRKSNPRFIIKYDW